MEVRINVCHLTDIQPDSFAGEGRDERRLQPRTSTAFRESLKAGCDYHQSGGGLVGGTRTTWVQRIVCQLQLRVGGRDRRDTRAEGQQSPVDQPRQRDRNTPAGFEGRESHVQPELHLGAGVVEATGETGESCRSRDAASEPCSISTGDKERSLKLKAAEVRDREHPRRTLIEWTGESLVSGSMERLSSGVGGLADTGAARRSAGNVGTSGTRGEHGGIWALEGEADDGDRGAGGGGGAAGVASSTVRRGRGRPRSVTPPTTAVAKKRGRYSVPPGGQDWKGIAEELQRQVDELKRQNQELQRELRRERDQRAVLMRGDLRAAQVLNDELRAKCTALEDECKLLKRRRVTARNAVKKLEGQVEELNTSKDNCLDKMALLEARLKSSTLSKAATQREANQNVESAMAKAQLCHALLDQERQKVLRAERQVCVCCVHAHSSLAHMYCMHVLMHSLCLQALAHIESPRTGERA